MDGFGPLPGGAVVVVVVVVVAVMAVVVVLVVVVVVVVVLVMAVVVVLVVAVAVAVAVVAVAVAVAVVVVVVGVVADGVMFGLVLSNRVLTVCGAVRGFTVGMLWMWFLLVAVRGYPARMLSCCRSF